MFLINRRKISIVKAFGFCYICWLASWLIGCSSPDRQVGALEFSGYEEKATDVKENSLLNFSLIQGDSLEIHTKEQVLKLENNFDLRPWIFTKEITIDSDFRTVPHSHPVLTLTTRHKKDDDLLLATFIHEQLHWFLSEHPAKDTLLSKLKARYPDVKTEFPYGSGGEIGTYYHIMICYLEYRALKQLLGELDAFQVISFWLQDHYYAIYETVLKDQYELERLAKELDLIPG